MHFSWQETLYWLILCITADFFTLFMMEIIKKIRQNLKKNADNESR